MAGSPLNSVAAIALDLDDTLFNKAEWVIPALEYAAQVIGLDSQYAWELATRYVRGRGAADAAIYNHVLVGCGQSDSAINIRAFAAAANEYRPKPGSLQLLPGAVEALGALGRHYELAVIADGPVACQQAKVAGLGLEQYCQHFVFSDAIDGIRSRRPDARPYQELLRRLAVRASDLLFVADNPLKDFIRPRQLGMVTARVLTGEFAHYDYPSLEHTADYEIGTMARLPQLLAECPPPIARVQTAAKAAGSDARDSEQGQV